MNLIERLAKAYHHTKEARETLKPLKGHFVDDGLLKNVESNLFKKIRIMQETDENDRRID